jgi:hypothetical protein
MRRYTDPLALDPLSPIAISPIADISSTDPLALEPLSPLPDRARPIDAGFFAADAALGPPRYFRAVGARDAIGPVGATPIARTGHATGDPPGRDALRAPAGLPS